MNNPFTSNLVPTYSAPARYTSGSAAAPGLTFSADAGLDTGLYLAGADNVGFSAAGVLRFDFNASRINIATGFPLQFGATSTLVDDAANVLALKNSTTAQTFRIYGTTASSKYLSLGHDGTNALVSASSGTINFSTAVINSSTIAASGFKIGATAGVDATVVIPAVATITISKGIVTGVA